MIQLNLFKEPGGVIPKIQAPQMRKPRGNQAYAWAAVLILAMSGIYVYLSIYGMPRYMADVLPESITSHFVTQATRPSRLATAPAKKAPPSAEVAAAKSAPIADGAVEEIVKTVRPDLFYNIERKEYRQLLPMERIKLQKIMADRFFQVFKSIAPGNFGFTDLVFKAPDYYFVRGTGTDSKMVSNFLDSLKRHSQNFKTLEANEKSLNEFTAYGNLLTAKQPQEKLAVVPVAQVNNEISLLNLISQEHNVQFSFESAKYADQGLYQRVLVRAQSNADFPSMQKFAEALLSSASKAGVLQVVISPGTAGMRTTFDFVIYAETAAPKAK